MTLCMCTCAHIRHSGCLIEAIFHREEWKCVIGFQNLLVLFCLGPFPSFQGTVQSIDIFCYVSVLLILHSIQSPVMLHRPFIQCTLFLNLWKLDFLSMYRTSLISHPFSFVCTVRKKPSLHTYACIYHTFSN
jgi:hypothetical protein